MTLLLDISHAFLRCVGYTPYILLSCQAPYFKQDVKSAVGKNAYRRQGYLAQDIESHGDYDES
jgi:hypothetical protein